MIGTDPALPPPDGAQEPQGPQNPQGPQQTQPPTKADLRRQLGAAVGQAVQGAASPLDEHKQQLRQMLAQAADEAAYNQSQEARGLAEHAKYIGLGVGKAVLDGTAHLASMAFRLAGAANPAMTPQRGYAFHEELLKQITGTPDPGVMDLIGAFKGYKTAAVFDPLTGTAKPMSVGDATDEYLRRKIGNYAVGANVAGTLLSFMSGPGSWLGRGATKAVEPLAGIAERTIAKSLMRGAGMAEDSVKAMLKEGRAMEVIAKLPEWKQTISLYDQMLMAGGRHVRDLMSMGAGNMAQAYGLLPDDERFQAAKLGLLTAPAALTVVNIGRIAAEKALLLGLKPDAISAVGDIYQKVAEGKIGLTEAAKAFDKIGGATRRMGADIIGSAFEGAAFPIATDPELRKKFGAWMGGDQEAGADIATSMLASMAGIIGHRYGTHFLSKANQMMGGKPIEAADHHLFRLVTPDLNRLNTRIQAEAVKQAAAEAKKKPQEPQPIPGKPDPTWRGQPDNRPPKPPEESWRERAATEEEQQANVNRQFEEMGAPDNPSAEHLQRLEADLQTRWSWADHLTLGVMRATHDEPRLDADGSVRFDFGPDFGVNLRSEGGVPVVEFDPAKVLPAMADAGRKIEGYDPISPALVQMRGDAAVRFLDDVTLVQMMQTMQGDLDFTRLGMKPIDGRPDLWGAPSGGGVYYQKQLDGSTVEKEKLGDYTKNRPAFLLTDGFDKPGWPSPAIDMLTVALQNKHALAPDNVIDGVIGRALMMAQYSDSPGAEQLRAFFQGANPHDLVGMLNPKEDQILAFQLGSLGVANNNAAHALGELQRMRQAEAARQKDTEASIAEDLAAAEPPMSSDDYRATLEDKPTAAERAAAAAPERQTQRARDRIEAADHTVVRDPSEGAAEGDYEFRGETFGSGVKMAPPEKANIPDLIEPYSGLRAQIQEGFGEGVPMDLPRRGGDGGEEQRIIQAMSGFDIRKLLPESAKKASKKFFQALTERYPELLRGKGDDAYVDEVRRVNARKGENVGAAQALERKSKRATKAIPRALRKEFRSRIVETEGGTMSLGQAIAEGRKFDIGRPITDAEKSAAEMWSAPMRETRSQVARAGGTREVYDPETGAMQPEPISEGGTFRTPRMPGENWADVMNDRKQRMELWKDVLEHPENSHLQIRDKETGERRLMTPEELDQIMLADAQAAAVDVPGRQAAVEFKREIQWFPAEWRGKKLLETDLEEIQRRVTRQQAGRAASLETWGPDLSPEQREYMKKKFPEWADRQLAGDRPGVEGRLKQAVQKFVEQAPSGEGPQAAQIARNIVTDIEGRIPKDWQFHGPLGIAGRGLHAVDQPVRSALTSLSATADPGDAIANQGLLYGRPWRTLKAIANLVLHPMQTRAAIRDAHLEARRAGLIVDAIGQNDLLESRSWRTTWSDTVQWLGNKVENAKIAMFTRYANNMLADWSNNSVTANDRRVVSQFLRFSAADQQALLAGKADPKLQAAFRREFVQFAVSRRPIGEGSAFSAHPGVRAVLRFTNWSSGNLFKIARIYKTAMGEMGAGWKEGNAKQFASGVGLGLKATGLLTGAGLVSKLLSYSVAGVLRGEGADGWDRFWREMGAGVSDPAVGARVLRDALGTQVLGGPMAFMLNAFSRADDPGFWAKMTTPGALYYALQKTLAQHNPVAHPLEFAMTLPVEMGYVPFGAHLKQAVLSSAALVGAEPRTREIMRRSWEWETLNGIDKPKFVRTKPDEFYDALANVRHAIEQHPDDVDAALKQSEQSLRKALDIGGEESVAATLRSYQFLNRVPRDKLDSYTDFVGDEGMEYVYTHDMAIREFARVLGFSRGENPTPLDRELETAQRQARLGGRQVWRPLADRVLDDAEVSLAAGNGFGEELRQVAESMAAFPEQQEWLSERQRKALQRPGRSLAARARLIEGILRERARERATDRKRGLRNLRRRGIELPQ